MNQLRAVSIALLLSIFGLCRSDAQYNRTQLKEAVDHFFLSLKGGICASIILNQTVRRSYIADSLIGRVQPVGTFHTTAFALEYLYGLLCNIPNLPPRRNVLNSVTTLSLTYDPNHYRTSFKIRVNLDSAKKLVFFGILAFDDQWKLCGYEAVIQNLGLTFDPLASQHASVIAQLCTAIQSICPVGSPKEQYCSQNQCISFLSEPNTPFGTYDRADQNNVVCRLIHVQLAQIDPVVHCPHLGKTGGGKCTDKPADYYFEETTDFVQCAHRYHE